MPDGMPLNIQQAPPSMPTKLVTPQEVFMFFSDPSEVIKRAKHALLGNCDWLTITNAKGEPEVLLVEWVSKEVIDDTGKRSFVKTWIAPPQNKPLVTSYTLWQTIEAKINIYCNPYFLLNKPDEPEDLATTIGIDFAMYLWANWKEFELDIARAHQIRTIVSDLIYGVLKGSEGGGYHKILTHVFNYNINETPSEVQKQAGIGTIFGGGKK